jgi:DNA-binding Xre family transcriptional regulator
MPDGSKRTYVADVGEGYQYDTNGEAWPHTILINSGPALLGFRDTPPAGYMDLYEATGGDIDDQWRAVASAMDADERLRAYATLWGTDLAATEGRGWRDFGAQTSAHERAHWGQMDAIFQYHADNGTGRNIEDLNNDELMDLTKEFMTKASPDILKDVFGIDIDDLIDKRFDALAGAYSQAKQQEALGELTGGGTSEEFNYARTLALMETLAELKANKTVGLIGDDPELDAILEKMDPLPPLTGGSISPSGGIVPSRPDGSPTPRFVPSGRVRPTLPGSAPALPTNAGRVVTTTPGRSGGRGRRGPVDPFEKERYGKVPTMIKEGRFTLEDIDEFLYGEDGKGGLKRTLESVANMKTKKNGYTDPTLVKRKRLLNELVDTMGISFSELEALAGKARRGESLTPEEKSKLVNAISHLRNGANEFKAKSIEARNKFQDYRRVDVSRATGDGSEYDDKDTNELNLEQIQDEIEMYESLFMRVGRTIAPAVHDILTMTENSPYPPRLMVRRAGPVQPLLGIDVDGADGIASRQASRLSPQELSALSSAVTNPPRILSSSNSQNISELTSTLENIEEVRQVFERNNLTPPITVADNELQNAAPVMSGLDKSVLPSDMVVELEIDTPEDTSPGSIYEMSQISSAQLITDSNTEEVDVPRSGFSSTTGMRTKAGIAGRLIASKKTRKLLEKAGIDAERTDVVQLMSEVAIGFSVGGPYGALIPIARRGSRDAAEQALKMMVERGWIEQDLANKIEKYGLDRIAAEGLPDEILNLAESAKDRLLTEESKRRALDFGSVLQERSIELSEATREKVSELADTGKEKARELAASGMDRARRLRSRFDRDSEELDAGDPFSLPPSGGAVDMPSPYDDPFKSAFVDIEFKQLGSSLGEQKQVKKTKVRVAVPAGSKGKIESGKSKASNMILPPGKVKFTGVGEDGVPEAEITEQMSAEEYMKNVEKMSSEIASSSNKPSLKKAAKLRADTAKKMRQEMIAKSGTPQSMSGISKVVFDKSNSIMERGKAAGINFFTLEKVKNDDTDIETSEYVRMYQEKLVSTINNYSKSLPSRLFDEEISADTKKFIYSNSVKEIVKEVNKVAMLIHEDIDRRVRVSMSKSSLEQFVGSGKIANIDVDSESLKILKNKRNSMLGNSPGIKEFSFTPVEFMHGVMIEKIEKQLYENGTHVGSEEFTDYGRGIELVLRAENSPRIGYGRKESYKNGGIFVQINEEDENLIQASIFGQMFMSKNGAEEYLAEIIEASLSGDYSKLIKKNDEDVFEAFIVGEISLNDVEHIKIPLSIFNIRKKRVPKSSMIGGADSINMIFMNRGVPKEKIKDFFDKDGTIGGGYTPKHLSYLNELEAAEEFKENLISLGISEVIFTNKDGIDIMSEDTWVTPPPTKKKGKDALREIARKEVMSIIDKIAPPPKKPIPKKETAKK